MRIGRWTRLLLAGVTLLAGCKGFWDPVSSSSGSSTTTTTLSSGYFFLLDTATSQLISYHIVSGTLTQVASYPVESTPITVAVAPNGDFLYVSTISGIYVYTIASGVLTLGNSSSIITSDPATAMQVDSSNSWLVESSGAGALNAIPINSTTGALNGSQQQVALSATTVNQLAFSANNAYVFAALGSSGTMEFSFKSSSSSTPLGSSATASIGLKGLSALSVAVDPSDRLVYVGETAATSGSNSGGLRAFSLNVSTGVLSEISVSPLSSGGLGPYSILPKSTGDYVYVANWTGQSSSGNIAAFEITASGSSYSLTKLSSTATTGVRPMSLAEDSTGDFVLAACSGGSPYFDAYIFDNSTAGQLDTTLTSSSYAATSVAAVP